MCADFFLIILTQNLHQFVPLPTLNVTFPLSVHRSLVILSEFVFTFFTIICFACNCLRLLKKKINTKKNLYRRLLLHQLTDVFFSFQQTPAFWEEEEVSDHLFFPFQPPSCFLLFASSSRRLFPCDRSRTHQILACRSAAFPGVFSTPTPPSVPPRVWPTRGARWSLLERPAEEHYHQSDYTREAEAAERGVGNNGSVSSSVTPQSNCTVLRSHLTLFFHSLWDMIEIIIPPRCQMRVDEEESYLYFFKV